RRVLQPARRIGVAVLADIAQQDIVSGAPIEAVGLLHRSRGAVLVAGLAARGIVDDSPRAETVVALVGTQDAIPIDEHADALLEGVGVEAIVSGGRLEPDQAPDALRFVQALARTGFAIRRVLVDGAGLGLGRRGLRGL